LLPWQYLHPYEKEKKAVLFPQPDGYGSDEEHRQNKNRGEKKWGCNSRAGERGLEEWRCKIREIKDHNASL